MSQIKATTLSNLAGSKTVPTDTVVDGSAKAWVNFNGTGTVAIRRAFNVSSITDNGTGDYTINFTNAMVDANYAFTGSGSGGTSSLLCAVPADAVTARTASAIRFVTTFANGSAAADVAVASVSIFS